MKKVLYTIVLGLTVIACKKTVTQPRSGIFRGVFEMTGVNGGGFETGDCTVALNDQTGKFVLSVDTTSVVPYATYGNYTINDGTKMNFIASSVDTSALVDQHLYLDSTYNYIFDDDVFELKKQVDTVKYEYRFVRY